MGNQQSPDLDLLLLYLRNAKNVCTPVTKESRSSMANHFRQTGDIESRNALVESGLLWVVKIAKSFARRYNVPCFEQDLIQEGNLGLIQAAEKFEPERGYSFTTYATFHIRHCIINYLVNKHQTVSLPNHKVFELTKLHRTKEVLEKKLKRLPTREEIKESAFPERSDDYFDFLLELNVRRYSESIDTPTQESQDMDKPEKNYPELVTHPQILAELESKGLQVKIVEYFSQTIKSPRDLKIVLAFFGLDKEREGAVSANRLSKEFGLTRQRVDQVIKKAIKNKFFLQMVGDLLK